MLRDTYGLDRRAGAALGDFAVPSNPEMFFLWHWTLFSVTAQLRGTAR